MRPKIGLYSVSYAGLWYNGKALSIKEFIDRAKLFKFECVELDGRMPHAVPFLLGKKDRKEINSTKSYDQESYNQESFYCSKVNRKKNNAACRNQGT